METAEKLPIPIAIVDDHQVISLGLEAYAEQCQDLEMIGWYPTVDALREAVDRSIQKELIVVLDLRLDDGSTVSGNVEKLREVCRGVVVYTSGEDRYLIRQASAAGAYAVVHKSDSLDVLANAIRGVANGTLEPSVEWAGVVDSDMDFIQELTSTEREILALYAAGETAAAVAHHLNISQHTVNTYVRKIRSRYESIGRTADSRVDLYKLALEDGLIPRENL